MSALLVIVSKIRRGGSEAKDLYSARYEALGCFAALSMTTVLTAESVMDTSRPVSEVDLTAPLTYTILSKLEIMIRVRRVEDPPWRDAPVEPIGSGTTRMTRSEDIRGAVARFLETDALFGAHAVPLDTAALHAARGASSPRPSLAEAPSRGRATPASRPGPSRPSTGVRHVQNVAPEVIEERRAALARLDAEKVKGCTKCGLCETRTNTVFGQGHPAARLVFVGEAPGADEDQQGLAFVGKAGQLLTKIIDAMGLTRDEVFICNILKCRPPNNRDPAPDEISACWPNLDEQLRIIQPEVIVALGRPAAQTLLRTSESIGSLRGRWHDYYISGSATMGEPTPLMPTYHPAYLLRSPGEKGKAWSDLKMVMAKLNFPVPHTK
jgi:DNA polymerase